MYTTTTESVKFCKLVGWDEEPIWLCPSKIVWFFEIPGGISLILDNDERVRVRHSVKEFARIIGGEFTSLPAKK